MTPRQEVQKTRFSARHFDFQNGELRLLGHFYNNNSQAYEHDKLSLLRIENLPINFPDNLGGSRASRDIEQKTSTTEATLTQFTEGDFFAVPRKVPNVNCSALFEGDDADKERASMLMFNSTPKISESQYQVMTKKCETFKARRRYITSPVTEEEGDFPIAFSIVTFKDIEQTERLLRAIYRPQNYYSINVDTKSKDDFRHALHGIADCFDNVFLSSRSVDVELATFTVLEPDLICMEDLLKYKKWKYFINLTGQEFPLRTNYELVKILTIYNGSNDVEGTVKRANPDRWVSAGEPPHGITPTKGSVHVAVNRNFVEYAVYNKVALDFLNWTNHTDTPDETYFSSLNHNPQLGIPGSYKGTTSPTYLLIWCG